MALTNVNTLAEEVANLLRHDNLDTRIIRWLTMAYNDMVSRVPCWRFYNLVSTSFSDAVDTYTTELTEAQLMGDPVLMVVTNTTDESNAINCPRYISYNDFVRLGYNLGSGSIVTGTHPDYWTIGPGPKYSTVGGTEEGKRDLYFYPGKVASKVWTVDFYKTYPRLSSDLSGTSRFVLPYHLEHVLVWGAASIGAQFLFPELYQIYKLEYEEALRQMQWVLTYKQDTTPILRSVTGPYEGTSRMRGFPRVPDNISTA